MKKNSKKTFKSIKLGATPKSLYKSLSIYSASDFPSAWNYKLKHKLPTKKQEQDFVDNLRPIEKHYTILDLKSPEELFPDLWPKNGTSDWFVYDKRPSLIRKVLLFLLDKCS